MTFYDLQSQFLRLEKPFCCKGGEFVAIWVTIWFSSLCSWRFPVTWICKDVENEYILLVFPCFRSDGECFRLFHDAWLPDFSGKPVFLSRMNFTDFTAVLSWRGWFCRCLRGAYICDSVLLIVFFGMFPKRCRRWFHISTYFCPTVLVGGWSFWCMPLGSLVFPANLFSCLAWFFTFCIASILFNGDCFDDLKSRFFLKGMSSSRYELRFDFPLFTHGVLLLHESENMSKMSIFSRCFRLSDLMGKYLVCFMTVGSLIILANLCSYLAWVLQTWKPFCSQGGDFLDVCLASLCFSSCFWFFILISTRKSIWVCFII